jgi:hypothetical protein
VFVVYTSNHEHIYKSLLPIHFPLVDFNVNKALPARNTSSSEPTNISDSNESIEPPRRSIFNSISDVVRGVRFGKQPATNTKRPPGSKEREALEYFERHARGCSKCIDIEKLYSGRGHLCAVGYAAAQNVLKYLYMDTDRSVYSTNAEGGEKSRVEIQSEFISSWKLLATVEKSSRDPDQSRPFVSRDQPWQGLAEQQQDDNEVPPGVTIYNAEITVPTMPEKAFASVRIWSDKSKIWEPLQYNDASIHIYPGNLRVYTSDQHAESQVPLLSLELTPLVEIERHGSLEVTVSKARAFHEEAIKLSSRVMLVSRSPIERQMLLTRLVHAAENNPAHMEDPSSHSLSRTQQQEQSEEKSGAHLSRN